MADREQDAQPPAAPEVSGTAMSDLAWQLDHVSVTFGSSSPVLTNLSASGSRGEWVTLLGPSGCGKSTTLRLLAGLARPARGAVRRWPTDDNGGPRPHAYQPQGPTLLPWKTCLENARLGAVVAGVPTDEATALARNGMQRFGLAGYEDAWPSALSGGMAQRLALLRAWLVPSDLVLLDEPLGALDAITRRDMQLWLQDVWTADRRTVVMVTHDVAEAVMLSDRVLVLSPRPARVVADVAVEAPRPRSTRTLLDSAARATQATLLESLEAR
jgi:ABC-type nitrate/sulfonate/bicarbonate transport system ATPase subunit